MGEPFEGGFESAKGRGSLGKVARASERLKSRCRRGRLSGHEVADRPSQEMCCLLKRLGVTGGGCLSHGIQLPRAFAEEQRRHGGRERRIAAEGAEKRLLIKRRCGRSPRRSHQGPAFGVVSTLRVAIGSPRRTSARDTESQFQIAIKIANPDRDPNPNSQSPIVF